MKEAKFYKVENNYVICKLCPHNCKIDINKTGICGFRKNIDNKLYTLNYGILSAINIDPIEKKPLYHFYPNTKILSIGNYGCNLKCKFCQNWSISQRNIENTEINDYIEPIDIIKTAIKNNSIGIAFTYNEPTIWYEYMLDIAKLAKENRLKTVMVTNGYINKEPLIELIKYIDAFSVDLKSYSNDFFIKLTSSTMQPVLESIELINEYKKHLEIDYLVITNENDNEIEFEKLVKYISKKLNKEIVLHINRYYPNYLLKNLMTPEKTMISLYNIAKQYLDYVYIGNINLDIGKNTYCNRCKTLLIERNYYNIDIKNLNKNGECENCGNKVIEVGNND